MQTGFGLNSMIFLVALEKWHIWQKNSNAHIHKHMLTPIVNKQTNPLLNIIIIPWMWIQIPNMEFPHRFPVLWLPNLNLTLRESQLKPLTILLQLLNSNTFPSLPPTRSTWGGELLLTGWSQKLVPADGDCHASVHQYGCWAGQPGEP